MLRDFSDDLLAAQREMLTSMSPAATASTAGW